MTSFGLAVVPVAVLIDEHGIVQSTRFRTADIEELVAQEVEPPSAKPSTLDEKWANAESVKANFDWTNASTREAIWFGDVSLKSKQLSDALKAYEYALEKAQASDDKDIRDMVPEINFRLGVVMRARYDNKELGSPSDFEQASKFWTAARAGNPNQYIWRRRIEQYGPRQIKPYPFYDWVSEAFSDIVARGDQPVALTVPLSGAEIAKPSKRPIKKSSKSQPKNPDPDAKITLVDDQNPLIGHVSTIVPSRIKPGQTVRVHLQFFPEDNGKWNNESSPMQVWINDSENGVSSRRLIEVPNAEDATSKEPRTVEFEFQTNKDAATGIVSGFALFNVCTDDDGQCLFRRRNFKIEIPLK